MLRPVAVVLQVSLHTIAPRPHQTRTGAHMATEAATATDDPAAESKQVESPGQLGVIVADDDETSSAKSFLLQLNLGNECLEMDCLTGDGDGDAAPSASATAEGAPPKKKGGQSQGQQQEQVEDLPAVWCGDR